MNGTSKSQKALLLALIGATALPMALPINAYARAGQAVNASDRAEAAALTESQKLAIQALIMGAIVNTQVDSLVNVDEKMTAKYQKLRLYYLGSTPTSIMGGIATYTGAESLKRVEFLFKPLTYLARQSWASAEFGSNQIEKFLDLIHFDKVTDFSSKQSERVWEHVLQPILKLIITKNTAISSGSLSAGGIFAGSVFFMMNDAKEAMTWSQVRNVIGQDNTIRTRIDGLVAGIAPIVNLSPDGQAKLKVLIYDDVLRQAVENKFSEDASKYSLDVIELMSKNNLVDSSTVAALESIKTLSRSLDIKAGQKLAPKQEIVANIDVALELAAVIEAQLASGNITNQNTVNKLQGMLGALHANLTLVGFNLKK